MGNVGADLPHAVDQRRKAFEGGIDLAGHDVDVVTIPDQRDAGVELAMRNVHHGRRDAIETALDARREQGATGHGEAGDDERSPAELIRTIVSSSSVSERLKATVRLFAPTEPE